MSGSQALAKPDTVDALVWYGGEDLQVRSFDTPDLAEGDLLVRVDLAAICGSDRHTVSGRRSGPSPSVLGHEAVGTVVARGDAAPAELGQRVVWGVAKSCYDCERCDEGRTVKCHNLIKTGHAPLDTDWGPLSGDYATHVLLPQGVTVVPVPDSVADEPAAISACAMATVAACMDAAGSLAGRRVAVIGAGMLGVCATAWAQHYGATDVLAVEPFPGRGQQALKFGATDYLESLADTDREFDTIIEVSGAETAISESLQRLALGGVLVLAGSVFPSQPISFDPERIVRQWLTIRGIHNYEPRHLHEAIDFLGATTYPWQEVMATSVSLAEAGKALCVEDRSVLRALIDPQLVD